MDNQEKNDMEEILECLSINRDIYFFIKENLIFYVMVWRAIIFKEIWIPHGYLSQKAIFYTNSKLME